VADLSAKLELLPGDCALAAGMVAYSGPFTRPYRQKLEGDWLKHLIDSKILHTDETNMRMTLGDPVAMQ